jgi:feruloyl esterase
VLRQCAPNESFVLDPRSCRVDVESLACAPGQDDDSCLNAAERELVATIYRGLEPGATGRRYGGPSPGAEAAAGGWMGWILPTGPLPEDVPAGADFARGFYGEFVRAEDGFDLVRLTERDVRAGHARFGAILNAIDPDLGEFARHGGRLIQYHGWNDPGIPASFSLSYYDAVRARLGATDSFHRLFMLPGVLHCGGGPGPDGVDWLAVLEGWVERGEAPEEVVARRRGSGTDEPGATMRVRRYRP